MILYNRVSTQDREQPDGDYVLDDQNQHFSSQSIEIDYDDYDFSGPTSRLETTSMIPIILVTASPTTSPPPFTTSTSTQGMIFALPTPPPDQTPTPFPELLNDDTMHLVQIPIASKYSLSLCFEIEKKEEKKSKEKKRKRESEKEIKIS